MTDLGTTTTRATDAAATRRLISEANDALYRLEQSIRLWCDGVRQDAEKRTGVKGSTDQELDTLFAVPDYSASLDAVGHIADARLRLTDTATAFDTSERRP